MKNYMKFGLLLFLSLASIFFPLQTRAQVPQRLNYQGIARDEKGHPLVHQLMSLKIAILPYADATGVEYEEIQTITTNEFGLYTLQLGAGVAVSGEMNKISWDTGNKYIRVMIDPTGGQDFQLAGTTQLLSVPYAFYAEKSGTAKSSGNERTGNVSSNAAHVSGDANFISKFTALNVIGKSQLFDNGTSVGLGTAAPISTSSMHIRRTSSGQYLYMENPDTIGFGSFRLYNDVPANFATFTKYGSKVAGGYAGIADKYPFANMLGYGNNGPFLNAGTGNIGFAITKAGTNKLKIHIDAATERIGLGGNAVPQTQVHFNNTVAGNDTLKFSNQTTGHSLNDGTELRFSGNTTRLINRENAALIFGTNNTDRLAIGGSGNIGIGTLSPSALLDVNGQVRIQGGVPGAGKVLTSDATGLATWQTPAASGVGIWTVNGNHISNSNSGNVGIGIANPQARLHVLDSSVVFSATGDTSISSPSAPPPIQGAGRRMMWYPQRGAFRAGGVGQADSLNWNRDSIGLYSVALGWNTKATEKSSFAMGEKSQANGLASVAMGDDTRANGMRAMAFGDGTQANGTSSFAVGEFTQANGPFSTAMGANTQANANFSTAAGLATLANGTSSTALGSVTQANGTASFAVGELTIANGAYATSMGNNTIANGYGSLAIGQFNDTLVAAQSSITAGTPLWLVGNGSGAANRSNALVVLNNGNVGVGNIVPTSKLEVAGQIKLTGGAPGVGKVLMSDATGLGSWQNLPLSNASLNGTTNRLVRFSGANAGINSQIIDDSNRVGINTVAPQAKLHLHESSTGDTLKLTNTVTGQTAGDGLDLRVNGLDASLVNREFAKLSFGTNDSTRLTIDSAGQVGIGTQTPGSRLQVSNALSPYTSSMNNTLSAPLTVVSSTFANNTDTAGYGIGNLVNVYAAMGAGTQNVMLGTGSNAQTGTQNFLMNNGDGIHYGITNSLGGNGNGVQYGVYSNMSNNGNGIHFASRSFLSGSGSGDHYGTVHQFSGSGSGIHFGTFNELSGSGNAQHFAIRNRVNGSGSGEHFGLENELSGAGTGVQFGIRNLMLNSGNGDHIGLDNTLSGTGSGYHTGVVNRISSGDGHLTGNWNEFSGSIGTGNHIGMFNNYFAAGSGTQAGTFTWFQGGATGTGPQYGSYLDNYSAGNGTHYGAYNALGGTGTGAQYGTYNSIYSNNDTTHVGTYNTETTSGNGFHYGTINNITSSGTGPNYGLAGSINVTNTLNSSPQYGSNLLLFNSGTGSSTGYQAILTNTGSGTHFGNYIYHQSTATGSGAHYGLYNYDISPGQGVHHGVYSRLSSTGIGDQYGVRNLIDNTGNGEHTGVYTVLSGPGTGLQYGVRNEITNTSTSARYGISNSFSGTGAGILYGLRNDIDVSGNGTQYGAYTDISSLATGTGSKFGYRVNISTTAGGTHYGIYSDVQKAGSFAGVFLGDVRISGELTPGVNSTSAITGYSLGSSTFRWRDAWVWRGTFNGSDIRLKTNVEDCSYGLQEILKLRTIRYNWKSESDARKEIGLVAQQVKELIPEVVVTADDSMQTLMMNYSALIPVLVNAIQDQQKEMESFRNENSEMRKQNAMLQKRLEALESKKIGSVGWVPHK